MSMFIRRFGVNASRFVVMGSPCAPFPILRKMGDTLGVSLKALDVCQEKIAQQFYLDWRCLSAGDIYRDCNVPLLLVYDQNDEELADTRFHTDVIQSRCPHASLFRTDGLGHYKILWNETIVSRVIAFLRT